MGLAMRLGEGFLDDAAGATFGVLVNARGSCGLFSLSGLKRRGVNEDTQEDSIRGWPLEGKKQNGKNENVLQWKKEAGCA